MTTLAPHAAADISPILEEMLRAYDLMHYEIHIPALSAFLEGFTTYNADHNLTGETDLRRLIERHVIESLFIYSLLPQNAKNVADIGTGGGFPGAIIACVSPKELQITLIESVQKKATFLFEALKAHPNVTVLASRVEDISKKIEYAHQFDCVTMRAVTDIITSVEYSLPLIKAGGQIILCKPKEDFDAATEFFASHHIALDHYSTFTIEGRSRGIGTLSVSSK